MINENLISESQTEYVMGILNLIVESSSSGAADESDGLIKFPMFCVIAALSQRIVALESTVARCINKLDLRALKTKRIIFQGIITLDSLRIELHAGRISQEHEDEAIRQLEQDGLENLNFMDFLVRWI